MTWRKYFVLLIVVLFAALGDVSLKRGMSEIPQIRLDHVLDAVHAISNPWVALGIALLLVFFAAYLTALSWADLTFVLPAASFGYVVLALLSQFWLHEAVTARRWVGILLVVSAVGFVTRGPALSTTKREPELPPEVVPEPVGVE